MVARLGNDSVVVGFDSSDTARDALALGARLAAAIGGSVVVAAVHPASPLGAGHIDAEWVAAMREDAEARLDRARTLLGADVAADYRAVASGSAAHGLDELAESLHATAIVLGSADGGPLRRLLAGSTAERLLQGASVPVALAPRGLRDRAGDPVEVIGCAFIDTPDGHEALRVAAGLAESAGARLRVYTVMARSDEFAVFAGREEHDFVEASRAAYQEAMDTAMEGLSPVSSSPAARCRPWPRWTTATSTCWSAARAAMDRCAASCSAARRPSCSGTRPLRSWSCLGRPAERRRQPQQVPHTSSASTASARAAVATSDSGTRSSGPWASAGSPGP